MLVGTAGVVGLMVLLNALEHGPPEAGETTVTSFEVKQAKKPPRSKPKRERRPERQRSKAPPPPANLLASSLGGFDFGFDAGAVAGLEGLTDSLVGDVGDVVMTDEAVDEQPVPVSQPMGPYPKRARAQGIEGTVTLAFLINQQGEVEDPEVVEADPEGWFEELALASVRQWRFRPAQYEGRPVRVRRELPLVFELQ